MRKRVVTFLFLITMLFLPFKVDANSIRSEIILYEDDITESETLKAKIKISQPGQERATVLSTRIEFDENVFSGIDASKIKGLNGWSNIEYNPNTHTLIAVNKYSSNLNEEIVQVELSLNESAFPTKTKIGLSNTVIANSKKDFFIPDISRTVQVNLPISQVTNLSKISENFGKTAINPPVKLYYILTLVLLEVVIASILALIYFAAVNKKMIKKNHNVQLAVVLTLIEVASISALFGFDIRKGDLNGDKIVDKKDISVLSKHMSNNEMLSTYKLEKADLNGDRAITPCDLSLLLDRVFTNTTYKAKLTSNILEMNGYEKGSKIDLDFIADVTDDEELDYVLLNGQKIKTLKVGDKGNYSIQIDAPSVSNKYDYNITEVILKNGRSAKVDYKTNVVVLKDAPEFSNFVSKEDVEHGRMNVAFTIKDDDDAITEATYELMDDRGVVAKKGRLDKGKNILSLALENAVPYKLYIKILYNRGAESGEHSGKIEDSFDLKLITDYKFTMSSIDLVQKGNASRDIEKNVPTYLEFASTNVSGYNPKKITISSHEYAVAKIRQNRYRVRIPNTRLDGTPLTITKVTLSNGKVITFEETINYNILKDKPSIMDLTKEEDALNESLSIFVNYKDSDNTLNGLRVELYDDADKLIGKETLVEGKVNFKTTFTSKYNIKVYADYDRGYGNNYKNVLLYEETIEAKTKAILNSSKVSEQYPDKNSIVNFDYEIKNNRGIVAKEIVINNCIYELKKIGVDIYRVEIDVQDISGIKTYEVSKVIFADGSEYQMSDVLKVDVLKEKPIIENFQIEENLEESRATFKFDLFDLDSAFTGGKLILKDTETEDLYAEKEIIPGKNSYNFDVIDGKKYLLGIYMNAELDTKELNPNSPNILKDEEVFKTDYMLIKDYELNVTMVETYKDGTQNETFQKDESVDVIFSSTNVTDYYPVKIKVNGLSYDVEREDEHYKFTLNSGEMSGIKELTFESIILNNHKEIPYKFTKSINVLKDAPEVDRVLITEVDNDLHVDVNILDEDEAATDMKVVIVDAEGKIVYEGTKLNGIIIKNTSNIYNIKVIGSYKRDSKDETKEIYKDVELFNKNLNLKDNMVDKESLKTFSFNKGELETEKLEDATFSILELENLGYEYVVKSFSIDDNNRVFANIVIDGWFIENGKISSSIDIEIGRIEDGIVHIKN